MMWTLHLQALSFLILYHAVIALAQTAGNTTCLSSQLDWYTDAVGETPCMTYQRLRQICNSDYVVGNFAATTPGDHCNDQVSDCCCNSVAFALSMLCMNCQEDAVTGDVAGIDAPSGTYASYLSNNGGGSPCSPITNQSLPTSVQQAVCNLNIKIDNFLYNRSYWSDGSWYYRWTADYAVEQQAANNNNTFTVCPNQVSPSASLPTITTGVISTGVVMITSTGNAKAESTSPSNTTSSSTRGAIIGGAVGGSAFVIIAVLGGVYCVRRGKRHDMPSPLLGRSPGDLPTYETPFTDTGPVSIQRYSEFSPQFDRRGQSTLLNPLSPEQTQSSNTSSARGNGTVSEAHYIREDDAGTLIPPHDAPRGRLPPAYHPSWVARNTPPRSSSLNDDQSQDIQTMFSDDTRPVSLPVRQKEVSRWSSSS